MATEREKQSRRHPVWCGALLLVDDLIPVVLSRLPLKSLLRFRCVCKAWRDLICSRDFIKLHLHHSRLRTHTTRHLRLILLEQGLQDPHHLYSVAFEPPSSPAVNVVIHHPLSSSSSYLSKSSPMLWGSCNGLLCLSLTPHHNKIILSNPSLDQHSELPSPPFPESGGDNYPDPYTEFFYGFWCSSPGKIEEEEEDDDDYKVVRVMQCYHPDEHSLLNTEVMVYSHLSNSWRVLEDFVTEFSLAVVPGVVVNGRVHWPATRDPDNHCFDLIIAFDLESETFLTVPSPSTDDDEKDNSRVNVFVQVVSERLCAVLSGEKAVGSFDIWVMGEYGVKESWTKLMSIEQQHDSGVVTMRPPLVLKHMSFPPRNGDKVLLVVGCSNGDRRRIIWYDLERNTSEEVDIRGIPNKFEAMVCLESLVPLSDGRDRKKDNTTTRRTKMLSMRHA